MTSTDQNIFRLEVPLALIVCIIFTFVGLGIHYYKHLYGSNPWLHESSVACIFGIFAGFLIKVVTGRAVSFNNNLFFYLILPPIIFSAGFSMKRKRFFYHIHQITFFGIVGTCINILLITFGIYIYGYFPFASNVSKLTWIQSLLLSAILSGTDELSAMSLIRMKDFPRLGALVFGEGIFNDALSIVLFRTIYPLYDNELHSNSKSNNALEDNSFDKVSWLSVVMSVVFQIVASIGLGVIFGLINARIMFVIQKYARKHPIRQTSLIMLFGYLSYSVAEGFDVSGILTLFVTAVTLAHYSWYSLSKTAKLTTRISFAAISDIAEGFAFSYVGLSFWKFDDKSTDFLFASYLLTVVILARLTTVLGLFTLCKGCFESFNWPLKEQLGFVCGGIVRGCLCWAQVLQVKETAILVTSTWIIVLTTSIGCGVVLPVLLPMLGADTNKASSITSTENNPLTESHRLQDLYRNHTPIDDVPSTYSMHLDESSEPVDDGQRTTNPHPFRRFERPIEMKKTDPSLNKYHNRDWKERLLYSSLSPSNYGTNHTDTALPPSRPVTPKPNSSLYHQAGASHMASFNVSDQSDHETSPLIQSVAASLKGSSILDGSLYGLSETDLQLNANPLQLPRSSASNVLSVLFIQWIRFDEKVMKPFFGGSSPEFRRKKLMRDTENLQMASNIWNLSNINTSYFSEDLGPNHEKEGAGCEETVEVHAGNQYRFEEDNSDVVEMSDEHGGKLASMRSSSEDSCDSLEEMVMRRRSKAIPEEQQIDNHNHLELPPSRGRTALIKESSTFSQSMEYQIPKNGGLFISPNFSPIHAVHVSMSTNQLSYPSYDNQTVQTIGGNRKVNKQNKTCEKQELNPNKTLDGPVSHNNNSANPMDDIENRENGNAVSNKKGMKNIGN